MPNINEMCNAGVIVTNPKVAIFHSQVSNEFVHI